MTDANLPPSELAVAFDELAARADAAQRLAMTALEMLYDEMARAGRQWDLHAEADRLDGPGGAEQPIDRRGRIIAAGLLRVLADAKGVR